MGIRQTLCFAAVVSTLGMWAAVAGADEQAAPGARVVVVNEGLRLPVAYVERPLTNSAGILTPELDLDISRYGVNGIGGLGLGGTQAIGSMGLGSGYAITDDFSVRAILFDLQFNDNFGLDVGELGATYRLLRGDFELGVALDWVYQAHVGIAGQDILPALPMHAHFGRAVRLDITPTLPISTAGVYIPGLGGYGGGKATVGLSVPLQLLIQPVDQFHFGVGTGLSFTFNPSSVAPGLDVGDTFYIPLNFEAGVSIPGPHGPVLDMTPFFSLPTLFVPGIDTRGGASAVQSGIWQAGVKFTTFFYL
jgi:hypothetical protein